MRKSRRLGKTSGSHANARASRDDPEGLTRAPRATVPDATAAKTVGEMAGSTGMHGQRANGGRLTASLTIL